MIVITGAAGFIGSCLVQGLNDLGFTDLVLVDDFSRKEKEANYIGKKYRSLIHRDEFFEKIKGDERFIEFILHIGARTNTAEFDTSLLNKLNVEYSKKIWNLCVEHQVPLIYASSAATYGDGAQGYSDDPAIIPTLKPLNPYGWSKQHFDLWALDQKEKPFFWAGLKFFNVYGPNEYHKGRMASVIFHAFNEIRETQKLSLFRSHRKDYEDGKQLRDFIYVKDVVSIITWLMQHRKNSGIYNTGTGTARSFIDLGNAVFKNLGVEPNITFKDIPEDIRDKYQYFTEADTKRLRAIGYEAPFYSLEEGVEEYVGSLSRNSSFH